MVQKPIKIKEPLINHILVESSLVFDNNWTRIFVYSKSVDTTAMSFASSIFRSQKANSKHCFQILLDQRLKRFLQFNRFASYLSNALFNNSEQLQVTHVLCSPNSELALRFNDLFLEEGSIGHVAGGGGVMAEDDIFRDWLTRAHSIEKDRQMRAQVIP